MSTVEIDLKWANERLRAMDDALARMQEAEGTPEFHRRFAEFVLMFPLDYQNKILAKMDEAIAENNRQGVQS